MFRAILEIFLFERLSGINCSARASSGTVVDHTEDTN